MADDNIKVSLALAKEGPYVPAIKFFSKEIFPTGKYKNLNPEKIAVQGLGDGAYKTEFGLNVSKVTWWSLMHPMQFRLSLNYGIATKIHVTNFNSYGGGYGTDAKLTLDHTLKETQLLNLVLLKK